MSLEFVKPTLNDVQEAVGFKVIRFDIDNTLLSFDEYVKEALEHHI